MCNAPIKPFLVAACLVMQLWGCSGSKTESAETLLTQAESALTSGDYRSALSLTDSIQRAYPTDAEARRAANHLHAKAMMALTQAELAANDSLLLDLQDTTDRFQNSVRTIGVDGSESYTVASSDKEYSRLGTFDGLHARLSPDGQLMLVSSSAAPIGHTYIIIKSGNEEIVSTPVPADGELNRRERSGEIVHHTGTMADSIARFIAAHDQTPVELRLEGGKASKGITLSPDMIRSISTLSQYRDTYRKLQLLILQRERLSRQLDVARNQVARTSPD